MGLLSWKGVDVIPDLKEKKREIATCDTRIDILFPFDNYTASPKVKLNQE